MNYKYIVTFVLSQFFLFVICYGQFTGEELLSKCSLCRAESTNYGDFDNDRDLDIVSISSIEETILLFTNDGTGNFDSHQIIHVDSATIKFIVAIDGNQDEALDIIAILDTPDNQMDQIVLYENLGGGQFDLPKLLVEMNTPEAVQLADMDGDGDLDLITNSEEKERLVWFENENNTFSKDYITIYNTHQTISSILAADIDNDGDIDLLPQTVIGNSLHFSLIWLENVERGKSWSAKSLFSEIAIASPSFVIDDIDQDGDLDIIASYNIERYFPLHRRICVYENVGDKKFNKIGLSGSISGNLGVGDLDGDGDKDLLINNDNLYWIENLGNSTFSEEQLIYDKLRTGSNLFLDDFDGDGDADIVTHSGIDDYPINYALNLFVNNGHGLFDIPKKINQGLDSPQDIYEADLNNDGNVDILIASKNDHTISWMENDGMGNFSKEQIISNQFFYAQRVLVADIDLDGYQDIIASSAEDEKIAWFKNQGNGTFSTAIPITAAIPSLWFSEGYNDFQIIDFDKDGDFDLIYIDDTGFGMVWLSNDGGGHFSLEEPLAIDDVSLTTIFATGDLDGDGDEDIVTASLRNDEVNIHIQEPFLRFSATPLHKVQFWDIRSISTIDMENDGDLDILIFFNKPGLVLYKNDGLGVFEKIDISLPSPDRSENLPATETLPINDVLPSDFDNDGDIDLVVANVLSVFWMENDGQCNYSPRHKLLSTTGFLNLESVIDIDKDGDKDILILEEFLHKISLYRNYTNLPVISGRVFWDQNNNQVWDSLETILRHLPIHIQPIATNSFTDYQGFYKFHVTDGQYEILPKLDACWFHASDSILVTVDSNRAIVRDIPLQLTEEMTINTEVRITSAPTRCGFEIPFYLSIENDGCAPVSGHFGIVLDSLTSFVEAHISPDEIRGDTLFWYHDQLNVSEIINIGLVLRIAGVEFIGETIQLKGLSYINGIEGNLMMSSSYDFQSEIRCGYDPNDKLVLPNRSMEYGLNYTLFEESLEYTIRFQNTGTDTAFNIVIKDVLDERLDWTTFQPITSSHPFETTLHSTGLVEFSFKNILLVDSIANELLSHGFVTYKISSKKELPENMHIENTANIYFDFNPPIITNTTTNVLVSQLPQTTSLNPIFVEQSVKVYPNPFKDYLIVEQSNKNFIKHSTISFFDVTGRRLQDIILTDVIQQIPISYLGKGLYFYQVITVDGNMIANGLAVKN